LDLFPFEAAAGICARVLFSRGRREAREGRDTVLVIFIVVVVVVVSVSVVVVVVVILFVVVVAKVNVVAEGNNLRGDNAHVKWKGHEDGLGEQLKEHKQKSDSCV